MIAYDLQACQSADFADRGIARFALSTAVEIEHLAPELVTYYLLNPDLPRPERLNQFVSPEKLVFSKQLREARASILHVTSPFERVPISRLLQLRPHRLVSNLYDLIPLLFPQRYLTDPRTSAMYRGRLSIYSASDWIFTDSESALRDALHLLPIQPSRASVVGAGADSQFCRPLADRQQIFLSLQQHFSDLKPDFLLLPTGMDWRKNCEAVIAAYSRLPREIRSQHQLVVLGRMTTAEESRLRTLFPKRQDSADLIFTGYVSDSVLVEFNQCAKLVVFPSHYEGFGLPVLEAMSCGSPVVTGDNSSLVEIQRNSEARFDTKNIDELSRLVLRCLTDHNFLESIRCSPPKEFTWAEVARKTVSIYEKLLDSIPRAHGPSSRRKLAVITPLPPIRSGIADYSYKILSELSKICDVECFVDQDLTTCEVPEGCRVSPLSFLPAMQANGSFDEVLFVLGNNEIHRRALDLLAEIPGVVHLHDVRLANCYLYESWPEIVAHLYLDTFKANELSEFYAPWAPAIVDRNLWMLPDVLKYATCILTNSELAASIVKGESPKQSVISIGPLASGSLNSRNSSTKRTTVASFGSFSPSKQSEKVLAAFRNLNHEYPEFNFVFVGECHSDIQEDEIPITGYVSKEKYQEILETTCLAVQLREWSNGESSAAVAECLNDGIPTLVTDIGSMSEIPDEAVIKVPRDISVEALTKRISQLLSDEQMRMSLSLGALRYASSNTFTHAAHRLFRAVFEVSPSSRTSTLQNSSTSKEVV